MNIYYSPDFVKSYRKFSRSFQILVDKKDDLFRRDPHHASLRVHKLKGKFSDIWSFSVNYEYRILFEYVENGIYFLDVGNHSIYK